MTDTLNVRYVAIPEDATSTGPINFPEFGVYGLIFSAIAEIYETRSFIGDKQVALNYHDLAGLSLEHLRKMTRGKTPYTPTGDHRGLHPNNYPAEIPDPYADSDWTAY